MVTIVKEMFTRILSKKNCKATKQKGGNEMKNFSIEEIGVEGKSLSTKELWGHDKVTVNVEEGIAWKLCQYTDYHQRRMSLPISVNALLCAWEEETKSVTITNSLVSQEKERARQKQEAEAEDYKKKQEEEVARILEMPVDRCYRKHMGRYYLCEPAVSHKGHPLLAEKMAEVQNAIDQREREDDVEKDEQEKEKATKKEAERIATVEWDAEKIRWIDVHGSERLKLAVSEGYTAEKQYVDERARFELSELAQVVTERQNWHIAQVVPWQVKDCPTVPAIMLEKKLKEQEHKASTVWGNICHCEDDECNCENHEMVIVQNYLDKYTVIVAEF